MIKRSGSFRQRAGVIPIVLLAFLLFGCGSAPVQPAQPASVQAIAAGNAEHGQKLYLGYTHFQNEGPPCMGCHSVGEDGLLGGGALGPDLTNVTTRRSQAEIISILSNSGTTLSPVMQPIFSAHPLTESEQADLLAFLKASTGQPESDKEWLIIGISLAGFVAAVAVLGFVYRGRLRSVRRALVQKTPQN